MSITGKNEVSNDKIVILINQIIYNFKGATLISQNVVSVHQKK